MPLKPHPTDPDKMVYVSRQYDLPKREWVDLPDDEIDAIIEMFTGDPWTAAEEIQARLKERNQ